MKKFLFLIIFVFITFTPFITKAGFGVSPPYIKNDNLIPGSQFETTIYLVRSNPSGDMIVQIEIDAPEIKDWITIEKGFQITLINGVQQTPMKVIINVPKNAALKDYSGYIRVKTVPTEEQTDQGFTALGGRIDISLTITGKTFSSFTIKGVGVSDFEQGNPLVVLIALENKGNIKIKPSNVHIDIYDKERTKILKSGDVVILELVEPFETKQISGEMQVDLEAGEYWADISIYKDGTIFNTFKNYFRIMPPVQITPLIEEEETRMGGMEAFFINIIIFILSIILR